MRVTRTFSTTRLTAASWLPTSTRPAGAPLSHTGVVACFAQAPLRHHRPLEFAERAVRADHFDRLLAFAVDEANRLGVVQRLRQRLDFRDDWISAWWAQDGWFWSKPVLDFWIQALAFSLLGVKYMPDEMLQGAARGRFPQPEWAALATESFAKLDKFLTGDINA